MSSTVKGNKVVFQNLPKSKYSKGNGRKFVGGITFQKDAAILMFGKVAGKVGMIIYLYLKMQREMNGNIWEYGISRQRKSKAITKLYRAKLIEILDERDPFDRNKPTGKSQKVRSLIWKRKTHHLIIQARNTK